MGQTPRSIGRISSTDNNLHIMLIILLLHPVFNFDILFITIHLHSKS